MKKVQKIFLVVLSAMLMAVCCLLVACESDESKYKGTYVAEFSMQDYKGDIKKGTYTLELDGEKWSGKEEGTVYFFDLANRFATTYEIKDDKIILYYKPLGQEAVWKEGKIVDDGFIFYYSDLEVYFAKQ